MDETPGAAAMLIIGGTKITWDRSIRRQAAPGDLARLRGKCRGEIRLSDRCANRKRFKMMVSILICSHPIFPAKVMQKSQLCSQ
jgi:hypothetical protein